MKRSILICAMLLGLVGCGRPAEPNWRLWYRSVQKSDGWHAVSVHGSYPECFKVRGAQLEALARDGRVATGNMLRYPDGELHEYICVDGRSWWVWWQEKRGVGP